ncbi:hypothetical protein B296_00020660 [Ensete ventricosum]|uniref:Uncharacterized protein n=1 Tax=Ensete ventricosum TaxID=4639 RepID=A0A427B1E7_ENSVE|nr:hypothetical protein B296_00020660 [Ensete ventricosum]
MSIGKLHSVRFKLVLLSTAPAHSIEDFLACFLPQLPFYFFCRCSGPGCCLTNRATWSRELLDEEAEQFISHLFVDPDLSWPWLAQKMAIRIPHSA